MPSRTYTHQDALWSKAVLKDQRERDGYNHCVQCGAVDNLQADHIMSYKDHPELRLDVNNGQVLCARHNQIKGSKAPTTRVLYINEKYLSKDVLRR